MDSRWSRILRNLPTRVSRPRATPRAVGWVACLPLSQAIALLVPLVFFTDVLSACPTWSPLYLVLFLLCLVLFLIPMVLSLLCGLLSALLSHPCFLLPRLLTHTDSSVLHGFSCLIGLLQPILTGKRAAEECEVVFECRLSTSNTIASDALHSQPCQEAGQTQGPN